MPFNFFLEEISFVWLKTTKSVSETLKFEHFLIYSRRITVNFFPNGLSVLLFVFHSRKELYSKFLHEKSNSETQRAEEKEQDYE